MSRFLANWTDENSDNFFTKPMKVKHSLEETGMFSDEALADLIERHPLHLIDVCTMGEDAEKPNAFRTGDFRGLSGAQLVKAAQDGDVWINLRQVTNQHDKYGQLLNQTFAELKKLVPGFDVNGPKGGILISSKKTRVPYHADQTVTLLWHVRGTKRFYVYPSKGDFLPDHAYESIILQETTEDVPYRAEFDDQATILRLEPGELAIWPLNAPHKVENETFCVSLTVECPTRKSAFKNSVFFANGVLRRKFGMSPSYSKSTSIGRMIKAAFGAAMRKMNYQPSEMVEHFVTFKIDPNAPGYIADTPPQIRTF
ncbi:MAG: hypothetical protein ACPGVT_10350 [Maricaulaceae bacterium]